MLDLIGCLIKLSTTEVTYCKVSNHFLMFGLLLVFLLFVLPSFRGGMDVQRQLNDLVLLKTEEVHNQGEVFID